jgi:KipI family sensor histidine kinase inhibitor
MQQASQQNSSYFPMGDQAILIVFSTEISESVHQRLLNFCDRIEKSDFGADVEVVPAYASVLIVYRSNEKSYSDRVSELKRLMGESDSDVFYEGETIEIPVCYGGAFGPDLDFVANHAQISREAVIERHSAPAYRVYMLGFMPGFPYLGGLQKELETPRLTTPRVKIPVGSVGIAGKQTGVYPVESPGGWQIIGRTPVQLFDPDREEPTLIKPAQKVKFVPISEADFYALEEKNQAKNIRKTGSQPEGIRILQPGFATTIQDKGRHGYRKYGIPVSGAMDESAMACANLLVGNAVDAACIEVTFAGPVIKFEESMAIALTGADLSPTINGGFVEMNRTLYVNRGEVLRFGVLRSGFRTYIAFEGGIDVPLKLSSKSTDLKSRIGGIDGDVLQAGDVLRNGIIRRKFPSGIRRLPAAWCRKSSEGGYEVIRVVKGPEYKAFTEEGLNTFETALFSVTAKSDRMGIRLSGLNIEHLEGADILSSGLCAGTIQVAGDGQPIVLMSDCQTTGGYTRIGCVVSVDLGKMAQMKPGDKVQFEWIEIEDAQRLRKEFEEGLSALESLFEAQDQNAKINWLS